MDLFIHETIDISRDKLPFKVISHVNESGVIENHWHRSLEISYTVVGKIDEFIISGRKYYPVSGTILVVNPNEIHSIKPVVNKGEMNICLTLIIPYSLIESHVFLFPYRYYEIPSMSNMSDFQKKAYKTLQMKLLEIYHTYESNEELSDLILKGLMCEVLYYLTRFFSSIQTNKNDHVPMAEFDWIDQVITYIQDNLKNDLTIKKLSKIFHLNESYFSRKFKRYMNISVKKYIDELRVLKSYPFVIYTEKQLQAISDECGFKNYKAFASVFQTKYKMTPQKYRGSQKVTKKKS